MRGRLGEKTRTMAEYDLTQGEADELLAMEKHKVDDTQWDMPDLGGRVSIPLLSSDRREDFVLDLYRGKINLGKGSYQNRARQVVTLARLDFGGSPHRNPDGEELGPNHLHIFREGYGDKWARPVPGELFPHLDDPFETIQDFMQFCNVVNTPSIRAGLFT